MKRFIVFFAVPLAAGVIAFLLTWAAQAAHVGRWTW